MKIIKQKKVQYSTNLYNIVQNIYNKNVKKMLHFKVTYEIKLFQL